MTDAPMPTREQLLENALRRTMEAADDLVAAVDAAADATATHGPRRLATKARALSALLALSRAVTQAKITLGV